MNRVLQNLNIDGTLTLNAKQGERYTICGNSIIKRVEFVGGIGRLTIIAPARVTQVFNGDVEVIEYPLGVYND